MAENPGTVLVVDDSDFDLKQVAHATRALGYKVVMAPSAEDAAIGTTISAASTSEQSSVQAVSHACSISRPFQSAAAGRGFYDDRIFYILCDLERFLFRFYHGL